MESASAFKCKDPDCSTLRNWYPTGVGVLPLDLARIICQPANCWWDAKLRRRYALWALGTALLLCLLVTAIQLIGGTSFSDFLVSGIVPLLPLVLLGVKHYQDQNGAAKRSDQLKSYAEGIWNKALDGSYRPQELSRFSRELQDEIYESRRRNPSIFDWIYNRL